MITDNEIDQICTELKKWVKDRNTPKASNTTAPLQTGYAYQYTVMIPNNTIPNQSSEDKMEHIKRLLHEIEAIAGTLIEAKLHNWGLSLRADVSELKELLGIKKE